MERSSWVRPRCANKSYAIPGKSEFYGWVQAYKAIPQTIELQEIRRAEKAGVGIECL